MTPIGLSPLFVLTLSTLIACFDKSKSDDDDDDGGGGGGGGWDLGLSDDTGGGGGGGDGGGGGTDNDDDGWTVEAGDCDDGDPAIHPGAEETWYDGVDQDCDEADDYDQDGDGSRVEDDCDDTDAERYPDAYDRPDDGIDQDCDDEDRSFDGLVLDPGESTDVRFTVDLPGSGKVDIGLVIDTTGSMSSTLYSLVPSDIADRLAGTVDDLQIGLASYADYNYSGYGSGSDKPYVYRIGSTDDLDAVDTAFDALTASGGSDGPESTIEALYQALTGAGYDQDCDESYDSADDVLPFRSSASDPFGGTSDEFYDPTTSGIGTLGGLGFRTGSLPILVYVTDNVLRDPDNGYGVPGGCPSDAGSVVLAEAALDMGAWLVGMSVSGSTAVSQMEDLADATGSLADTDGDGRVDDRLVYTVSSASALNSTIASAIEAIAETGAITSNYDLVAAEASLDPRSLVREIDPPSYAGVDTSVTSSVDFTVTLTAPASAPELRQTTVEITVEADGEVVHTEEIAVELAPSG